MSGNLFEDLQHELDNLAYFNTPDLKHECFDSLTDEQRDAVLRWYCAEKAHWHELQQKSIAKRVRPATHHEQVVAHSRLIGLIPFAMDYMLRRWYSPMESFGDFLNTAFNFIAIWLAHFIVYALFSGLYQATLEDRSYTFWQRLLAALIAIAVSAAVLSGIRL